LRKEKERRNREEQQLLRKKTLPEGVKWPHHFFIKRKPNRLTRVEKPPELWPMPMRAKACGEHSEGFFFSQ